jgi:hypothetical protein
MRVHRRPAATTVATVGLIVALTAAFAAFAVHQIATIDPGRVTLEPEEASLGLLLAPSTADDFELVEHERRWLLSRGYPLGHDPPRPWPPVRLRARALQIPRSRRRLRQRQDGRVARRTPRGACSGRRTCVRWSGATAVAAAR